MKECLTYNQVRHSVYIVTPVNIEVQNVPRYLTLPQEDSF